jgi:hypothetical protein
MFHHGMPNARRGRSMQTPGTVGRENRSHSATIRRDAMGKGILLWLLGIPIPIIILLLIFWH